MKKNDFIERAITFVSQLEEKLYFNREKWSFSEAVVF